MLDLGFWQESCHLLRPSSEIGPLTRLFLGSSALMSSLLVLLSCPLFVRCFTVAGRGWLSTFCSLWHGLSNTTSSLPRGPHPTLITEDITGYHGKGENSACQEYKNIIPHTLPFELSIMKEIHRVQKKRIRGETWIHSLEKSFPRRRHSPQTEGWEKPTWRCMFPGRENHKLGPTK